MKEVIFIEKVSPEKKKLKNMILYVITRLLIVFITVFLVTAFTFYSVQSKLNKSSFYLMNSESEHTSENTFSVFHDTFRAYINEAFPELGGESSDEK